MDFEGSSTILVCQDCLASRVVSGLAAAVASDLAAQGMALPCTLSKGCGGTLMPSAEDPPAQIRPRPRAADTGRHVWACHQCKVPLLYDYLYGFPGLPEEVPCPACGAEQLAQAKQDWPRGADGAQPMNLQVHPLASPRPAASPLIDLELRTVTLVEKTA